MKTQPGDRTARPASAPSTAPEALGAEQRGALPAAQRQDTPALRKSSLSSRALKAAPGDDDTLVDASHAAVPVTLPQEPPADTLVAQAAPAAGLPVQPSAAAAPTDAPVQPSAVPWSEAGPAASGGGSNLLWIGLGGLGLAAAAGGGGGGGGGHSAGSNPTLRLKVQDGAIAGAKVYLDKGDGQPLQYVGQTGADGALALGSALAGTGTLVAKGGVNTDTGLDNTAELKLAFTGDIDGTVVVSPITTLIQAVAARTGDLDAAQTLVLKALGLPSTLQPAGYDALDPAHADATGLAVRKAAAQLSLIDGTLGGDARVFDQLAGYLSSHPGSTLSLSDPQQLASLLQGTGATDAQLVQLAQGTQALAAAASAQALVQSQQLAATPHIAGLVMDTGATDGITADPRLQVLGLGAAGGAGRIELSTDGGQHWQALADFAPAPGALSVVARLVSSSGQAFAASAPFQFELVPSKVSAPGVALVSDSGLNQADGITNSSRLHLTTAQNPVLGSAGFEARLEYSVDGIHYLPATLDAQGNLALALADGSYTVFCRYSYPGLGLSSSPIPLQLTLDTSVDTGTYGVHAVVDPEADATVDPHPDDLLLSSQGAQQLVLSGRTEAGAQSVEVDLLSPKGAHLVRHLTPAADGSWSLAFDAHDASPALADGTYVPTLTVTDRAGNVSAPVVLDGFTVDSKPVRKTAFALDPASDSGYSATDSVTQARHPTFSGITEPGATVLLFIDGDEEAGYTTVADPSDGRWSVTLTSALDDGDYEVEVRITDLAGNVSDALGKLQLSVDNEAPSSTSAVLVHTPRSDTGLDSSDGITNAAAPVLEGSADPRSQVLVQVGSHVYQAQANRDGNWKVAAEGLEEGKYTIRVTEVDAAGNRGETVKGDEPFVVDRTAPAGTTARLVHDADNDTGPSHRDNLTANDAPTLEGRTEALAHVRVKVGSQVQETDADDKGYWSVSLETLKDGQYTPLVTVTDLAGNKLEGVAGDSFTVDTKAPSRKGLSATLVHDALNDTGASADDSLTANHAPTLQGTAAAGAQVHVDVDGTLYAVQADAQGQWRLKLKALSDGDYTPTLTVVDGAGNESEAVDGATFTVDTEAPTDASAALVHDEDNDTGADSSDGITANNAPRLEGDTEALAHVRVQLGKQVAETDADADGHWSLKFDALADGTYTPRVTVTDTAGNTSSKISGEPFTVDTKAPTQATAALVPDADNDTGFDSADGITNNNAPTLEGHVDAGAHVRVRLGGQTQETDADDSGYWSVSLDALDDGTYTPKLTVTDLAGNPSRTLQGESFTVDTAPEPVPSTLPHQVALVGQALQLQLGYAGLHVAAVGDYGGTLPDGLSIDDATQQPTGSASSAGMTWLSVDLADAAGNANTSYAQLAVVSAALAPDDAFVVNNRKAGAAALYLGTEGDDPSLALSASNGDVLLAGKGYDTIKLLAPGAMGFARIDGGDGIDTVQVGMGDFDLDLADFNRPDGSGRVLQRVEALRFDGPRASLSVSAEDLFNLQSDQFDIDGVHRLLRVDCSNTNRGTVTLDGLEQTGESHGFTADGSVATALTKDLYTKFTGTFTDSLGVDHLVELLLHKGMEAA